MILVEEGIWMLKKKETLSYLFTVFLSALLLLLGWLLVRDDAALFQNTNGDESEELLCQVLEIKKHDQTVSNLGSAYYLEDSYTFDAKVLRGERKGQTLSVTQRIDNMYTMGVEPVDVGDKIFVYSQTLVEHGEESISWTAGDYYRSGQIGWLLLFFCGALLLFGRKKGFNTVLSLAFTCIAIFVVFVPSILAGKNPYLWSCLTCLYVIAMTLALVSGYSRKSLASALGCAGGVLVAGLMTLLCTYTMKLSGFLDDDSLYVYLMNPEQPIDLKGILFASNIIGAMGATMDVAMSLSSSLFELKEKAPDLSFSSLFFSGIRIGQDIMGTMANTLVLAYIGSSLSTVLLFLSYQASLSQLLNRELIIAELLQALSGSIGILFTIPISALISATLYSRSAPAPLPPAEKNDVLFHTSNKKIL